MSSTHPSATAGSVSSAGARSASSGLTRLIDEVTTLLAALLSPRSVIDEVEQMSALHRRANAVEAKDPEFAAQLRRQAARIGLR